MIPGGSHTRARRNREIRDMSRTQRTTHDRDRVQPRRVDPLADVGESRVLRCIDARTEWRWFYDVQDGEIRKYHERHGYEPIRVSKTDVAETVSYDRVSATVVSDTYLEVERGGETDG